MTGAGQAVQRRRTAAGSLAALLAAWIGAAYVVDPSFGAFELLPDAAPFVGNLDEAAAAVLAFVGLRYLFSRDRTDA
jgi:hypothetical protein